MKKLHILLCLSMLLTGCFKSNQTTQAEYREKYENYMGLIIDNSKQITTNIPFDWSFTMAQSDDKYAYEVVISNPRVAMEKIQMIAVDIEQITESTIAPCVGLFEDKTYNMIPNQINVDKGYYPGIGVNGITDKSEFILNCLVVYKDKNQVDNYVYFIINADINDFIGEDENNE